MAALHEAPLRSSPAPRGLRRPAPRPDARPTAARADAAAAAERVAGGDADRQRPRERVAAERARRTVDAGRGDRPRPPRRARDDPRRVGRVAARADGWGRGGVGLLATRGAFRCRRVFACAVTCAPRRLPARFRLPLPHPAAPVVQRERPARRGDDRGVGECRGRRDVDARRVEYDRTGGVRDDRRAGSEGGEVRAAGTQLRDAGVPLHVPASVLKRCSAAFAALQPAAI